MRFTWSSAEITRRRPRPSSLRRKLSNCAQRSRDIDMLQGGRGDEAHSCSARRPNAWVRRSEQRKRGNSGGGRQMGHPRIIANVDARASKPSSQIVQTLETELARPRRPLHRHLGGKRACELFKTSQRPVLARTPGKRMEHRGAVLLDAAEFDMRTGWRRGADLLGEEICGVERSARTRQGGKEAERQFEPLRRSLKLRPVRSIPGHNVIE